MSSLLDRRKKRYICTFKKKDNNGELKGNLVVIAAHNEVLAQAILCETKNIPATKIKPNKYGDYVAEGIISIRLSETNTYEGDSDYENFCNNS